MKNNTFKVTHFAIDKIRSPAENKKIHIKNSQELDRLEKKFQSWLAGIAIAWLDGWLVGWSFGYEVILNSYYEILARPYRHSYFSFLNRAIN